MSWGDPQVPRAYVQDAPTLMGPRRLREAGLRPPDWTLGPADKREPWEMCSPEEIDAWIAEHAVERATLKRTVAASLCWLARDFGRALLLVLLLASGAEAVPADYTIEFHALFGQGGTGTFTVDGDRVTDLHVELLGRLFTLAGASGDYLLDGGPWHFGGFGPPVALFHDDFLELKTIAPLSVILGPVGFVPARALTMGPAFVLDPMYPTVGGQTFGRAPDHWFVWSATPLNDVAAFGTYTLSSATAARSFAATSAPTAIPHAATGVLVAAGLAFIRIRATHGKRSVHLVPDHQAWRILYFLTLACGLVRGERVTEAGDAPICQRCAAYAAKRAVEVKA